MTDRPPAGDPEHRYRLEGDPAALRAAERRIAACWALTAVAALGLAGVYIAGGQPQLEGALLLVSLGALGLGFILLARDLLPGRDATASRGEHASTEADRDAVGEAFERGDDVVVRRSFLLKMLGLAAGALGIAAVFPIRSLGPGPGNTLEQTSWRKGSRLVTQDGRPVRFGDLKVNGLLTVFPEGHTDDAISQTVLINVGDAPLELPPSRRTWAPMGYVAYSKVCTHAGCPVGLYSSIRHELLCPCHQSTFKVLEECKPVFGPASRPLPQLPIEIGADNYLVAQSDYTEPVGPGYWNRS